MSSKIGSWLVPECLSTNFDDEWNPLFKRGFVFELLVFHHPKYPNCAISLELFTLHGDAFLLESLGIRDGSAEKDTGYEYGPRKSLYRTTFEGNDLRPVGELFLYNYWRRGMNPLPDQSWQISSANGVLSKDAIETAWELALNDDFAAMRGDSSYVAEF